MVSAALPGRGILSLLIFVCLVAAVAAFGAQFEPGSWYEGLKKPSWNPPNWIFGPVWTVIYIAMAVAGWLVWRATGHIGPALQIWAVQLLLNALWSWLFFGLYRPDLALIDIAVLLAAIVAFMVAARHDHALASWLFAPYAAWVAFAAVLNFQIWRMNPANL